MTMPYQGGQQPAAPPPVSAPSLELALSVGIRDIGTGRRLCGGDRPHLTPAMLLQHIGPIEATLLQAALDLQRQLGQGPSKDQLCTRAADLMQQPGSHVQLAQWPALLAIVERLWAYEPAATMPALATQIVEQWLRGLRTAKLAADLPRAADPVAEVRRYLSDANQLGSLNGSARVKLIYDGWRAELRRPPSYPTECGPINALVTDGEVYFGHAPGLALCFAAPSAGGKTTCTYVAGAGGLLQCAEAATRGERRCIVFASYETPLKKGREGLLCSLAELPRKQFRVGINHWRHEDQVRLAEAERLVEKFAVFVDMRGIRDLENPSKPLFGCGGPEELATQIERALQEHSEEQGGPVKPIAAWIDHAQAMADKASSVYTGRDDRFTGNFLRKLPGELVRLIATPHECACWITHQTGASISDSKHRPGDAPTKADFAESRQFAQYCDFGIVVGKPVNLIERDENGKNPRKVKLVRWEGVKNREGPDQPHRIVEIGDWRLDDRTTDYKIEGREIVPIEGDDQVEEEPKGKKKKGGK